MLVTSDIDITVGNANNDPNTFVLFGSTTITRPKKVHSNIKYQAL